LIVLGVISCKDEDTSSLKAWNENSEARMSTQASPSKPGVYGMSNVEAGFLDALDGELGPNLSITGGSGTIAFNVDQGTLLAGAPEGGDDGRVYIGTNASNYITSTNIGFVAEVSITINAGDHNDETAFLGVGEGIDSNHGGLGPSYDEPSGGSAFAYFGVRDNSGGLTILNDNKKSKSGINRKPLHKRTGPGTHRFRLTYDGTYLHLSAQIHERGDFIEQFSIDVSDNGFDETNSRIFFGGSNEATFNDFEVLSVTTISQ